MSSHDGMIPCMRIKGFIWSSTVHMPCDAMAPGSIPLLIIAQVRNLFRTRKVTRYQITSVATLDCSRACIDFHASPDWCELPLVHPLSLSEAPPIRIVSDSDPIILNL